MATHGTRISALFAQAEATSLAVHDAVLQAMTYVAYSHGAGNYPFAAETAKEAIGKALELVEQLRAVRSTLCKLLEYDAPNERWMPLDLSDERKRVFTAGSGGSSTFSNAPQGRKLKR